jgi:ketosteroid isomerase-like protein
VEIGQCAVGKSPSGVREFRRPLEIIHNVIPRRNLGMKRISAALLCLLLLTLLGIAKSAPRKTIPAAPDKAYLQRIWDGWSTLDPANVAKNYATGAHTFFDIAPLKYNSWEEYEKGAKNLLSGYKSAKFTMNDDTAIHASGDLVWATSTVKSEMTTTAGKIEMSTFRWTGVFENQDGKWTIVHEHVSAPLQ